MIVDLSAKASYQKFADFVQISKARVQQLVNDDVLTKGETLGEWQQSYIENLRKNAAGHINSKIQGQAQLAKARKDKLDGDLKEIKIGELTSELGDIGVLEKGISAISESFYRTGNEAKEKILQGIKAELDIDVPPELINEPINEHLASLEGANPRELISTS